MGGLSLWHWIVVGAVVFVVFGGKFKISDVMGDVAKGIKAFKKGMAEDEPQPEASKPSERPSERPLERLTQDQAVHDKLHDKADEAKKV